MSDTHHKDEIDAAVPDDVPEYVEVPVAELSQPVLRGVVEEFITREATDYGFEVSFDAKFERVLKQLEKGDALIVYNTREQSTTLMTRRDFAKLSAPSLDS